MSCGEREAVRLSATEAHEQPMPNKDEAWATESRRFLRGCRKQSGADGVAAELAKARTEDGSGLKNQRISILMCVNLS